MAKAEARKEVRRKQLIDATMRAIGRYGYASLTLTHVAGEAGLSPGIVNFYFKSKDQLLIATLENIAEEYSNPVAGRDRGKGGFARGRPRRDDRGRLPLPRLQSGKGVGLVRLLGGGPDNARSTRAW